MHTKTRVKMGGKVRRKLGSTDKSVLTAHISLVYWIKPHHKDMELANNSN